MVNFKFGQHVCLSLKNILSLYPVYQFKNYLGCCKFLLINSAFMIIHLSCENFKKFSRMIYYIFLLVNFHTDLTHLSEEKNSPGFDFQSSV